MKTESRLLLDGVAEKIYINQYLEGSQDSIRKKKKKGKKSNLGSSNPEMGDGSTIFKWLSYPSYESPCLCQQTSIATQRLMM